MSRMTAIMTWFGGREQNPNSSQNDQNTVKCAPFLCHLDTSFVLVRARAMRGMGATDRARRIGIGIGIGIGHAL